MRRWTIIFLWATMLASLPVATFGQEGVSRKKQEKILAKKEVKAKAKQEKKDRKRHLQIQDKETRKRIKRHTKRADRHGSGTHRDGFPRNLFQRRR